MKKLAILLFVVLIVILSLNTLLDSSKAQDQTLGAVTNFLNKALGNMSNSELATLEGKFTTAEFDRAKRLITDWGILLRIATEAGKLAY